MSGIAAVLVMALAGGAYVYGDQPAVADRVNGLVAAVSETFAGSDRYGDWLVRCIEREGLPPCDIVQSLTDNDTQEVLMQFSVAYSPDQDLYAVQIRVPLGYIVSAGTVIRIDGEADITSYVTSRCEVEGCFIESLVTGADLAPFEAGSQGAVVLLAQNGQPFGLPFSLDGFSAALQDMVARNRGAARNRG